jgi:hypothetical protein
MSKARILKELIERAKGGDGVAMDSVGKLASFSSTRSALKDMGYKAARNSPDDTGISVYSQSGDLVKRYDNAADAIPDLSGSSIADESYKMAHTAPRAPDYPTGDNLEDVMPGIYGKHSGDYLTGLPYDDKALNVIRQMKDNPSGDVTVYRSVPKSVNEINEGDWVASTREYAETHAEGEKDWHVLSKKVKAKDIANEGNIHEFGYKALAPAALGLGALYTPEQNTAQAAPTIAERLQYGRPDSIQPEEFPRLEGAADFLGKYARTPLGPELEGLQGYLRNFGRDRPASDKAMDYLGLGLDFM